ncbi:MAG: TonB family protein [Armatimonadota bacterium]|nr:TonB family protein [Armatimonadota bacterium]MDR7444021.1 TonB family protein [Armatimonadota bacterium]
MTPEPVPSPSPTELPPASEPSPPVLTPPRPLLRPHPTYPGTFEVSVRRSELTSEAALLLPEGRVRLKLLVRADGTVGSVEILVSSGVPELDRAALEALKTWHFEPARQDGTPIPAYYVVWVTFRVEP